MQAAYVRGVLLKSDLSPHRFAIRPGLYRRVVYAVRPLPDH